MSNDPRGSGFREVFNERDHVVSDDHINPPSYRPWPEHISESIDVAPELRTDLYQESKHKKPSVSLEVVSPGLESVWADQGDKEVVQDPELQRQDNARLTSSTSTVEPDAPILHHELPRQQKRTCGVRRIWVHLVPVTIVIVVGLAAGLGAGLGTKHSSSNLSSTLPATSDSSDHLIGGALNPQYFTNKGAFNGTGIAVASQSFDTGDHGSLVVYFQHWSGDIRWIQLSNTGSWVGGSVTETVANDAKNGTPISAVAYVTNETSTWHIFYIDSTNTIKQKTSDNITDVWVDGPASGQNLVVNDADQVSLQACWYGSDYGDSDYQHTPLPSDGDSSPSSVVAYSEVGMHLWYASDATTLQQYGWRDGDMNWTSQGNWTDVNGYAGIACYSWGPGTVNYVMMVNLQNTVEVWWKDTDSNQSSTAKHPINSWTNSSIAINNVQRSSALGYTNVFYAQAADDAIMGYNISWAAENTTFVQGESFAVQGDSGLPGTHMSVTAMPDASGGNSLVVFFQTLGSDISEFRRDLISGQWSSLPLPIPDS